MQSARTRGVGGGSRRRRHGFSVRCGPQRWHPSATGRIPPGVARVITRYSAYSACVYDDDDDDDDDSACVQEAACKRGGEASQRGSYVVQAIFRQSSCPQVDLAFSSCDLWRDMLDEPPRGLRPNYSCGSLAAAEQLEALMHHPPPSAGFDGLSQHQRQLYAAGAALGGMYGGVGSDPTPSGCISGRLATPCEQSTLGSSSSLSMFGNSHSADGPTAHTLDACTSANS